jgi:hypothetical protein
MYIWGATKRCFTMLYICNKQINKYCPVVVCFAVETYSSTSKAQTDIEACSYCRCGEACLPVCCTHRGQLSSLHVANIFFLILSIATVIKTMVHTPQWRFLYKYIFIKQFLDNKNFEHSGKMLSSQLFCMCRCRWNFLKAPSRASKVQIRFLMCLCCIHYPEIQEWRLMRFANLSVLLRS